MWVHDLRAGEIACTLSHVSAWRRAFRSGATTLAVFEDDCTFSDAGVVNVVAALQTLRGGLQWDIVRLSRSNADPLRPVADDGEEVARFNALHGRQAQALELELASRAARPHHSGVGLVDRGVPAVAARSGAAGALRTGAEHHEPTIRAVT